MPRRSRPLWETSWRYAGPSALKYPRAASLATSQERLVGSGAGHAKIRRQTLSLQNKLKFRMVLPRLDIGVTSTTSLQPKICSQRFQNKKNPYSQKVARVPLTYTISPITLKGACFCHPISRHRVEMSQTIWWIDGK